MRRSHPDNSLPALWQAESLRRPRAVLTVSMLGLARVVCAAELASCAGRATHVPSRDGGVVNGDTSVDGSSPLEAAHVAFCSLPGSVVWSSQGPSVVPGAPATSPDLTWLTLPPGFCAHYYGT